MTSTLSTIAISSAASPTTTTYADPGTASFTATLHNIGDIVVLPMFGGFTQTTVVNSWAITGTGAVTSPNGAGTLYKVIGFWNSVAAFDMELWYGIVTATGSATFTATYSAALNGNTYCLQEWTTANPANTLWTVYSPTSLSQPTGSTSITFPSITPIEAAAAYVGYVGSASACTAGSTSGYTYVNDGGDGEWAFNPACTSAAQAPTCTQASAQEYGGIAALVVASPAPQKGLIVSQAVKRRAFR